jgi:hypothetical protein
VAGQLLLLPIVQLALQPSPSILLPSSHCYDPRSIPSPQKITHVFDVVLYTYPVEQIVVHVELVAIHV